MKKRKKKSLIFVESFSYFLLSDVKTNLVGERDPMRLQGRGSCPRKIKGSFMRQPMSATWTKTKEGRCEDYFDAG